MRYHYTPTRKAKNKNLAYQILVGLWSNWNSHILLMGA